MDKDTLRKTLLNQRKNLSSKERATKSEKITGRILELDWLRLSRRVMVYVHIRDEVQTDGLIKSLLEMGKEVVIPVMQKEPRGLIASRLLDFPGDLDPGVWGIWEPRQETFRPVAPETIDLVLVPGVAFDGQGGRIGYGGGYYDRFLPSLRDGVPAVALAFDLQVVERVPREPLDISMDAIVTESRLILCGEGLF